MDKASCLLAFPGRIFLSSLFFLFLFFPDILLRVSMFVNVYEYSWISFISPSSLLGNTECYDIFFRFFEIETTIEQVAKYQNKIKV